MSIDQRGTRSAESLRLSVSVVDPDAGLIALRRLRRRRTAGRVIASCAGVVAVILGAVLITGPTNRGPLPAPAPPPKPTNGMIVGSQFDHSRPRSALIVFGGVIAGTPVLKNDYTAVSFSPTGDRLAYLADDVMHVRDVVTGADRAVGRCGPRCDPDWSPVADQLVVSLAGRLEIWDLGSRQRQLITIGGVEPAWPTWSPDGSRIAFVAFHTDLAGRRGRAEVLSVPAAGGTPTTILSTEGIVLAGIDWAPDGSAIALATEDPLPEGSTLEMQVQVMRPDGTGLHVVADLGECYCVNMGPTVSWSPDSTRLAITGDRAWTIRRDGSDRRPLPRMGGPLAWQPVIG